MNTTPIKKRDLKTARKLTVYLPGLGHLYCGDFSKAISLIFGSIISTSLCIIAWAVDSPRTVFYLLLCLFINTAIGIWSYFDIKKVVLRTREDYRLKDYNRPWIYGFFFLTYALAIIPVAVFTIKTFIANPFYCAEESLSPTITVGDRVMASKIAYRTSPPQAGDLIIFRDISPTATHFTSRIIAQAGDTVEIKDNQILINNIPETTSYQTTQTIPLKNLEKFTLTATQLFVLADNRDNADALDSREIGPISIYSVAGKINFRFWPLNKIGSLE